MSSLFFDDPDPVLNGKADQFHLIQLQIYNWGTFSDLHTLQIAQEGHLFTGKSGSGKSTLLDAHAALLTPPKWKDYNVAAAQEGEKKSGDRNDMTYLRGAWAQQTDEDGESVSQFLRQDSTWSAICETYKNGHGFTVVLGQLLWVKGRSTQLSDLQKRYFCLTREFSLRELAFFPESDFDTRLFKTKISDCNFFPDFSAYRDTFAYYLHIDNELSLKLLHRTQSAKNLGDLNTFLRDFMLDAPETFEIKDRLVQEFNSLKSAHQSVIKARRQIEVLQNSETLYNKSLSLQSELLHCRDGLDGLVAHFDAKRMNLYKQMSVEASTRMNMAQQDLDTLHETLRLSQLELTRFENKREESGGQQIAQWEEELRRYELEKKSIQHRVPSLLNRFARLGSEFPATYNDYLKFRTCMESEFSDFSQRHDSLQAELDTARQVAWKAQQEFREAFQSAESLSKRRSNIPEHLQQLRDRIIDALHLNLDQLPFAGELIEVRPDESAWQGAIERVLASFANSLLVPEDHYHAVNAYINDNHLGQRLVYLLMRPHHRSHGNPGKNSLIQKVQVRQGAFEEWVSDELNERFDYFCVETSEELSAHVRAVSKAGLVRHNQVRHEKNDITRIDDRSRWVLGYSTREKLLLLQENARELALPASRAQEQVDALQKDAHSLQQRKEDWAVLEQVTWEDIDLPGKERAIRDLEQRIASFVEGNQDLKAINQHIVNLQRKIVSFRDAIDLHNQDIGKARQSIDFYQTQISLIRMRDHHTCSPKAADLIEQLLKEKQLRTDTQSDLDTAQEKIRRDLDKKLDDLRTEEGRTRSDLVTQYREFNRNWPEDAGDLLPVYEHRQDYLHVLERLLDDRLPDFEEHFLRLLTEQSDRNLMMLNTQLDSERRNIRGRLESVNSSLRQVWFNREQRSYLVIEIKDRALEDVREFRQRLKAALSHTFSTDIETAEQRFEQLDTLVADLASQAPDKQRWQKHVLDVRLHVEFLAREFNEAGEEVNVYRSGAGKSGGQRQLLSATVLAAALRYQLGGRDRNLPRFCTIVLDEAFDKADSDFTRSALSIFKSLGFQLVLATPGKSLDTIQNFVGSISVISIKDQQKSAIIPIEYLQTEKRIHTAS